MKNNAENNIVVDVQGLETTFFSKTSAFKAVNKISYQIHRGETLGIVGESGCGKSVTSFSLMRLIENPGKITGGKVFLNGRDLLQLPESQMEEVRGGEMAMIFQEPMTALNPLHPIWKQIAEPLQLHQGMDVSAAKARALELLERVQLPRARERLDAYPHQLSGGMRQRVMIAMALINNPSLLIADEPTSALDVSVQARFLELLQELQGKLCKLGSELEERCEELAPDSTEYQTTCVDVAMLAKQTELIAEMVRGCHRALFLGVRITPQFSILDAEAAVRRFRPTVNMQRIVEEKDFTIMPKAKKQKR